MDQRQINIVSTQLFQTFLQAWDQLVFAEVLNPDFGGDEKLMARYAALLDSLTYGSFVVINLRRINSAIAQLECGFNRCDNNVVLQAKSAQTQCRDSHIIPQSLCS